MIPYFFLEISRNFFKQVIIHHGEIVNILYPRDFNEFCVLL